MGNLYSCYSTSVSSDQNIANVPDEEYVDIDTEINRNVPNQNVPNQNVPNQNVPNPNVFRYDFNLPVYNNDVNKNYVKSRIFIKNKTNDIKLKHKTNEKIRNINNINIRKKFKKTDPNRKIIY
jgi:hypothetical protein